MPEMCEYNLPLYSNHLRNLAQWPRVYPLWLPPPWSAAARDPWWGLHHSSGFFACLVCARIIFSSTVACYSQTVPITMPDKPRAYKARILNTATPTRHHHRASVSCGEVVTSLLPSEEKFVLTSWKAVVRAATASSISPENFTFSDGSFFVSSSSSITPGTITACFTSSLPTVDASCSGVEITFSVMGATSVPTVKF